MIKRFIFMQIKKLMEWINKSSILKVVRLRQSVIAVAMVTCD
jgi:hypothetical protein